MTHPPPPDRPGSTGDDKAQEIADAILADLTDRRGIRQAFDEIDREIREEIRETMAQIIRDRL